MHQNLASTLKKNAIYIDGKDKTDEIKSYSFLDSKCVVVYKSSNKSYSYPQSRIKIVKSAIQSQKAENVFNYLKEIANTVGLSTEEGNNILSYIYDKISFIPESSILSSYLNGVLPNKSYHINPIDIFPFGFNLSQKEAVNKAFANELSIIEGPPGTGKTQTILNIIANAVMNGQSVAVVSSNNSATKNVYEKLHKNHISFIAAILGSVQNKKDFIESQTEVPDLGLFRLSPEQKEKLEESNKTLFIQLTENLSAKNELASLNLELEGIKTEYEHFLKRLPILSDINFKRSITSQKLLLLWIKIEDQERIGRPFNWWKKYSFRFKYGIKDKDVYKLSYEELITIVQQKYYSVKISELSYKQQQLQKILQNFSFTDKMNQYTETSMLLFKNELYNKYKTLERPEYTERELLTESKQFLKDYPVIMSTTYSLRKSLSKNIVYDFVIIDEASQVDLTTGALALSCAKRAVIVGDLKQLPNVITADKIQKTQSIFKSYNLNEAYCYSSHSLLSSITNLFPEIPKTLLKEHYRCHPKIIDFCNRRFYNNELIILSEPTSQRKPLIVYRTVPGNHARERINQRQIDVIVREIIPQQQLETTDLGIVTPYRNQTSVLQNTFENTDIKADTVDKFQGRENKVIILSTVDNQITEFTDNPNRLNVAISRAIDQLILVVNGNELENDTNIDDLIRYIDYNNFDIINSDLHSIFDYLYKGYEEKLKSILFVQNKKSVFDSENLMYVLINEVLSLEQFLRYDVILHLPIRSLILDFSKLTDNEQQYAKNPFSHLDFLIYNKFGKNPVLAIEVDGYQYHNVRTKQHQRDQIKNEILRKYNIPLLRFSTTHSGEREKLISKLIEITK
ncbi:AAA domain-containing protein [Elizabethkingia anophelis]|uniref:AAA domain-containing protein n=1 Tax=Elizabethkingia anophelis TaxID=1117645 RepID=UPI003F1C9FAE